MSEFIPAHSCGVFMRGAWLLLTGIFCSGVPSFAAQPSSTHTVRLVVQAGYLPQAAVPVRVELVDGTGRADRSVWDAEAILSVSETIALSTNRVILRNGAGTALVTINGSGDFELTATVGPVHATSGLRDLSSEPITRIGGSLPGTNTTWRGIVNITNDVSVPPGHTLTIESNTLVLVNGVGSGTSAADLLIAGSIQVLGTEMHPVTITCASNNLRWGQIRHNNAQPSLYRYASITRAGRAPGEGHTSTGPAIRPTNSRIVFEQCTISDHAERSGTPGKVMQASGSDLVFDGCVLSRSRMGPEIGGTALLVTNSFLVEMYGPDDADGIYIHSQGAGQSARLVDSVVALGEDDGIDTLGAVVEVENCIIRDWASRVEDAKGISVFNGATHVRNCVIVDCTVGITAKWNSGAPTLVTVHNSTLTDNLTNLWANLKGNAPGPFIDFRVTNCVLWGGDPVQSDFGVTNFTLGYNLITEPWPGTNNLELDPLFVDTAGNDYRLRIGSPAIDAGEPNGPPDSDGSRADIGALAFEVPRPLLGAPRLASGGVEFLFSGYTNRNYRIEYSTNGGNWGILEAITHSDDPRTISDSSTDRLRLYRARLVP